MLGVPGTQYGTPGVAGTQYGTPASAAGGRAPAPPADADERHSRMGAVHRGVRGAEACDVRRDRPVPCIAAAAAQPRRNRRVARQGVVFAAVSGLVQRLHRGRRCCTRPGRPSRSRLPPVPVVPPVPPSCAVRLPAEPQRIKILAHAAAVNKRGSGTATAASPASPSLVSRSKTRHRAWEPPCPAKRRGRGRRGATPPHRRGPGGRGCGAMEGRPSRNQVMCPGNSPNDVPPELSNLLFIAMICDSELSCTPKGPVLILGVQVGLLIPPYSRRGAEGG